jgi:hypothetical protein
MKPPKIKVINIDTSPFMLAYNRDFLWKRFVEKYHFCKDLEIAFEVNSWNNGQDIKVSNPWLAASYLFDITDDKEVISKDFITLVKLYKPQTVLLLTSAQPQKEQMLATIEGQFKGIGYSYERIQTQSLIYSGQLPKVNEFRQLLFETVKNAKVRNSANWNDHSFSATVLTKQQVALDLIFDSPVANLTNIDLYNPPLRIRRNIQLNELQKKAARHSQQPAIIVGPAGCGKSIVVTERIKNILEAHDYDPNIEILVTTFNKGLVKNLGDWISDILNKEKVEKRIFDTNFHGFNDGSSHFRLLGTSKTNIRLLHFDMLPKYLGGIRYRGLVNEAQHIEILEKVVEEICVTQNVRRTDYENILNPEFLFEEYHRVVYGLQCRIRDGEEQYFGMKREGRGNNPSLQKNSLRRKLVWMCLEKYAYHIYNNDIQSFTTRRQRLLFALKRGVIQRKYDYVIVDEFQDCTNADFEIFYLMLKNPDNLIIAGDLAQAVHIGKAAKVPRDDRMQRRQFFRLEGSYRLPVRISECIKDLSIAISNSFGQQEGTNVITPYKGSPPGARPIIVYAETLNKIVEKLKNIFTIYKIYDLNRISILEKDNELCRALNLSGVNSETDTILRLKGLEKECILWNTRVNIEYQKEVYEFVYTILTRTSSVLIIALSEQTQVIYKPIINLLRRDRLILWDIETKAKFDEFCEVKAIEIHEDEE